MDSHTHTHTRTARVFICTFNKQHWDRKEKRESVRTLEELEVRVGKTRGEDEIGKERREEEDREEEGGVKERTRDGGGEIGRASCRERV